MRTIAISQDHVKKCQSWAQSTEKRRTNRRAATNQFDPESCAEQHALGKIAEIAVCRILRRTGHPCTAPDFSRLEDSAFAPYTADLTVGNFELYVKGNRHERIRGNWRDSWIVQYHDTYRRYVDSKIFGDQSITHNSKLRFYGDKRDIGHVPVGLNPASFVVFCTVHFNANGALVTLRGWITPEDIFKHALLKLPWRVIHHEDKRALYATDLHQVFPSVFIDAR